MEAHQSTRLETPSCVNPCLPQILRIRWPDTISNEELWRRTQQRPIPEDIKERKYPTPGPNKDHKTGTPKGSAGEVVQPRLGKEP